LKTVTYVQLQSTSISKVITSGTLDRMGLTLAKPPLVQIARNQEFFKFSANQTETAWRLDFANNSQICTITSSKLQTSLFKRIPCLHFFKFTWTQRPGALWRYVWSWSWTYQIHRTFNRTKRLGQCSWHGASTILSFLPAKLKFVTIASQIQFGRLSSLFPFNCDLSSELRAMCMILHNGSNCHTTSAFTTIVADHLEFFPIKLSTTPLTLELFPETCCQLWCHYMKLRYISKDLMFRCDVKKTGETTYFSCCS